MNSDYGTGSRGKPGAALSPSQPLPLLRPMELGELLDESFDLYKKNFRLFFGISVLITVPLGVLVVATQTNSPWQITANVLSYVGALITTCALTHAAMERHLRRETTIAAAYRVGISRFLRLLSGYLIYSLAMLGGLIALVIPGLLVALWAILLVPIVVVENRGGVGAFKRARHIAAGNVWRLFMLFFGLLFVIMIFVLVLAGLGGLIGAFTGTSQAVPADSSDTVSQLIQAGAMLVFILFNTAWTPVLTTAELLMYVDLRIRREAYDLELLTAAAEARVAAARDGSPAGAPLPGQVG